LVVVTRCSSDDALRENIQRLYQSPLGGYVSETSREGRPIYLGFDGAVEDLHFTIQNLQVVLRDAAIESILPHMPAHLKH
jgi:hypothetical protein